MPFPLIPTALGVSFFLVWVFIAGMIFRDGQLAARRERETDGLILPLPFHRVGAASKSGGWHVKKERRSSAIRAAS